LGGFLKRLEIYTNIPPTPIMTDIVVKILLELLSVLALATKQIKQGRLSEPSKFHRVSMVIAQLCFREVRKETAWEKRS
jgi:hypothetical protein